MAMEGVWKTTRKLTTYNAFFVTPDQRDAELTETFQCPAPILERLGFATICRFTRYFS
jgi:hypothetical protein